MNRFLVRQSIHLPGIGFFCLLALFLSAPRMQAASTDAKPPTPPGCFLNPLGVPPLHLREPFLLPCAKKYFLFGTPSPAEGFQCYESADLVHWGFAGWAWRKLGLHVARGELHSPQVFAYQGMFWLVYNARTPTGIHLGLAASIKPEGPYHDLHVPWLTLDQGSIAADVFIDSNGKPYLFFTRASQRAGCRYREIYGVALHPDLSRTVGEPVRLLEASQRWELVERNRVRFTDTPRAFKLGSKYYLLYSANDPESSDRAVGYAVADQPLGPWTKGLANPLLRTRAEIGVLGPGHGTVFRSWDRSEWFVVYDSLTDPANPRESCVVNLDRLLITGDGQLAVRGPTRSPQPLQSGGK